MRRRRHVPHRLIHASSPVQKLEKRLANMYEEDWEKKTYTFQYETAMGETQSTADNQWPNAAGRRYANKRLQKKDSLGVPASWSSKMSSKSENCLIDIIGPTSFNKAVSLSLPALFTFRISQSHEISRENIILTPHLFEDKQVEA